MARLNTTTYQMRNYEYFTKFSEFVHNEPKTILHIGPGGILKAFAPMIGPGFFGRLVKIFEQMLRRIPYFEIESFEPFEIYEIFEKYNPELTVVDIHDRVLDSIIKKNNNQKNIKVKNVNIAEAPFPNKKFDVVICVAVINWETQPYKAMIDNVIQSVEVGGYLFLTTNFTEYVESHTNLEKLDKDTYKRIS